MERTAQLIERVGGARPTTCPWRAFWDEDVATVINAYAWFESGQIATFLGDDPPNVLIEGVSWFHRAMSEALADDFAKRNKEHGQHKD